MSDREQEHQGLSPALAEARRKRERLHEALVRAEATIGKPAPGRVPDWTNDVVKALVELRDAFESHIVATESPGGLYEEILTAAPRLAGTVRRLGDEHPVILAAIGEQVERVAAPMDADGVDQARDAIQRVLGRVVRHRQHGADLVWEAYNLDIGGPE
jgi:hypothetical protein